MLFEHHGVNSGHQLCLLDIGMINHIDQTERNITERGLSLWIDRHKLESNIGDFSGKLLGMSGMTPSNYILRSEQSVINSEGLQFSMPENTVTTENGSYFFGLGFSQLNGEYLFCHFSERLENTPLYASSGVWTKFEVKIPVFLRAKYENGEFRLTDNPMLPVFGEKVDLSYFDGTGLTYKFNRRLRPSTVRKSR